MADEGRISQIVIEIASPNTVDIRESQNIIEILSPVVIGVRQEQEIVEILSPVLVNSRITQNIIEVIMPGIPDVSGIYFINTHKTEHHDSFYADKTIPGAIGIERKIPDPTIKLAYLGD